MNKHCCICGADKPEDCCCANKAAINMGGYFYEAENDVILTTQNGMAIAPLNVPISTEHDLSDHIKLVAENAALRKVLESCREQMSNLYSNDLSPSGTALDEGLDNMLNLIEQTLSKGETE